MENQKEIEYIRKILDGDTSLFSYFLQQYSEPVFGLINKIVKSTEESEELVQDVFVKAFNKLNSFNGKSKFSTWLYRIAYNSAISKIRKKKIEYPVISDAFLNNIADDEVNAVFDKVDNEKLLKKLEKAVNELGPEDSSLITLYYYSEKPVQEISEILDLSVSNVKIRLHRVRKKLYTMINYDNDGER
jgi:RNA polymerase sigma-70 factor, ECF subfamily